MSYINNAAELAAWVEGRVRFVLAEQRRMYPDNYCLAMLVLYEWVKKSASAAYLAGRCVITSGFFNKVIADMKRAGIVGTTKGAEKVFLTEAAFQMYMDEASSTEVKS